MRIGLLFLILVISPVAIAQQGGFGGAAIGSSENSPWVRETGYGVTMSGSLGQSNIEILPPDSTESAIYSGLSLRANLSIPFFEHSGFQSDINFSGIYMDLENNANDSSQRENANHVGPGLGLHLRFYRIFAGVDYHFMQAKHYWVGTVSDFIEFEYRKLGYIAGVDFTLAHELRFGLSYESHSSTLGADALQYSDSSELTGNTVWFFLQYNTAKSFGDFFTSIFGSD